MQNNYGTGILWFGLQLPIRSSLDQIIIMLYILLDKVFLSWLYFLELVQKRTAALDLVERDVEDWAQSLMMREGPPENSDHN